MESRIRKMPLFLCAGRLTILQERQLQSLSKWNLQEPTVLPQAHGVKWACGDFGACREDRCDGNVAADSSLGSFDWKTGTRTLEIWKHRGVESHQYLVFRFELRHVPYVQCVTLVVFYDPFNGFPLRFFQRHLFTTEGGSQTRPRVFVPSRFYVSQDSGC